MAGSQNENRHNQPDKPEESKGLVGADDLRLVMRQWTSGVAVVSSFWQGQQHGMTVSSFSSISLHPPVVMIALARDTRTFSLVEGSRTYGVSILGEMQKEISERFAGRIADTDDRFEELEIFYLITGAPLLTEAVGWLDCRVTQQIESGNSMIFLGRVIATRVDRRGYPLVYYHRGYHRLVHKRLI